MSTEPTVEVRCQECGVAFDLSRRNQREHVRQGTPDICRPCRLPGTMPSPEAIAAAKAWWLRNYSVDELRSMELLP